MPITNDHLLEFIDPAAAVTRSMNASERQAFAAHHLVGAFAGKTTADWIADPGNTSAFLPIIDKWWTSSGQHLAYLVDSHQLPVDLVKRVVNCSMYVTFALHDLNGPRRSHLDLANGACLWILGYAEALGWQPA
jgi:hypothetical protein